MRIRNIAGPGITVGIQQLPPQHPIIEPGEVTHVSTSLGTDSRGRVVLLLANEARPQERIQRTWATTDAVREAAVMIRAAAGTGMEVVPITVRCSCGCDRSYAGMYQPADAEKFADNLDAAAAEADRRLDAS